MSMLRYLKRVPTEDTEKETAFRSAEKHVSEVSATPATCSPTPKKRGTYVVFSPSRRYEIGKHAALHGSPSARRKYATADKALSESTVRNFKSLYLKESKKSVKRKLDSADSDGDCDISELTPKKRGRKLLLGEKIDDMVQDFVKSIRESGGVINTAIVMAATKGIIMAQDRTLLVENGGHIDVTKAWTRSLLIRMNFVKRKATTSKKVTRVDNAEKIKEQFLTSVEHTAADNDIPPELIINWDQTGLHVVPVSQWTMAKEGSKRVEITGVDDKRQITATFAGTPTGKFLPMQLIYGGKTDQCHPKYKFPDSFNITHSENHWANGSTMTDYIEKVIVPYVDATKEDLDLPLAQKALVIFDCFRGQITDDFLALLRRHRLVYVTVSPNCTDLLQPMDLVC